MIPAGEGNSAEFIDEAEVDTIELELRPEDLARPPQTPDSMNQVELTSSLLAPRKRRLYLAPLFGVAALAAALVWLWSVDPFHAKDPPASASTGPRKLEPVAIPISASAAEPPPTPQGEAVKFANPFDATEVFEFPAGTNAIEARQAVAELLLHRARERRSASAE